MNFFKYLQKSIKNLINTLFIFVVGLLTVFGLLLIRSYVMSYLSSYRILENARNIGQLNLGTIELSLERSVSQVTLNIPSPITVNFQSLIRKQRDLGTPKIESVIKHLSESGNNPKAADRLKSSLSELNDLRKTVDKNLMLPIEEREKEFIQKFHILFPNVIEEIQSNKFALQSEDSVLPTKVQLLEAITQYAWEVREFGGRERTYFAIALFNKQPISSELLERMTMLSNRAEYAWKNIQIMKQHPDLNQEVLNEIVHLERAYFSDYYLIRERLKQEAIKGNYTMEFGDFFEKSSAALGNAESLAKLSVDTVILHAEKEKQKAVVYLITISFFTIFALVLCIYLLHYLNQKVVGNIIRVTNILDSLSKGNKDINYEGFHDLENEIGSMVESSKVFLENLLRLEKLMVEQSSAVNETTQVVEMLDKSSKMSAEQAGQVSEISQLVLKAANEGEQMASQMKSLQAEIQDKAITINDCIKELEIQTNQIGSITDVVSELAKQTNMLALNAAVEASRAGEFGRGFSVVSIEIRKLSDESKNSAHRIQGLIDEIKKSVRKTVSLTENGKQAAITGSKYAEDTSLKFKDVASSIGKLSDNMSSIAINLRQQVRAHEEVLVAMNSLNNKTRQLVQI